VTLAIAQLLKPFVLLGILGGLLAIRHLVIKYFPDGKLKRILLSEV